MKFQNKLMLGYLPLCVIPLIIVSVVIFNRSAVELENSSQEFAALYTSQIRTSLNELMKEYDKVTKSVLIDNELIYTIGEDRFRSMDELILQRLEIQQLLMRLAWLKPEIGTVMLIGRDNSVHQYSTTTKVVNEALLLSQHWLEQIRMQDETLFLTGVHDRSYYSDDEEGALVTVGRILFNSSGAYAGVLLIDLDPFALMQLDQDFVSIRDKYGMSVSISNQFEELVYQSDAASGRLSWQQIMESDQRQQEDTNSKDKIVLTESTQVGNLLIKTEIPREKLLFKINQIKGMTVIIILISCLIITFISVSLSYTITKPIKALRKSMKQAELGQYLPIDKKQDHDEIGSLVNSYNKMIVTIRTLIEDVYIAEIKQRRAKFIALQNQINPHMLYNTLESIRMKALMKDDDETAGMIKILARMFRLALDKEEKQHSIKDELDYTSNYVQLQNMRFDNKFMLHIKIPEEIQQYSIIPIIFQPIVENCINHGFQDYSQTMNISIEGKWTGEDEILIRITDDGMGLSKDKQKMLHELLEMAGSNKYKLDIEDEKNDKGIGLKNIAERIKLNYGDQYYLTIGHELTKGTIVEILIPKNRNFDWSYEKRGVTHEINFNR